MHISKISIKNYRNFGNKGFEMKLKKFTAIIGENNIGKTNLLESIGLILSQDITMFRKRMLQIEDINYSTRLKFKNDILDQSIPISDIHFPEVIIQLTFEGMDNKQLSVVGDWFSTRTMEKAKLTYVFKPTINFDREGWITKQREKINLIMNERKDIKQEDLLDYIEFPIKSYHYFIYGGNDRTNRVDPYLISMLKLELLDALRDAKRELIANGDYKLLYRILSQGEENSYEDIKAVLGNLDEKIKGNKQLKNIRDTIIDQLNKISLQGTGENNIDFYFSTLETGDILRKLSLIYGQDPITIDRNGLGRNNLLYISLLLSRLAPEENIETCFRIVGIEEPEAHLHPHLQKHLANNIEQINDKRDDLQIIITSHSTHITSSLNLDNTAVLYKDGLEIKKHYITDGFEENKKDKEHRRYLDKYLDATNSSMFYSRKIILVEGIAEQILVPSLFNLLFNRTIDSIGCNIINVNGVAFKHFLEIIKNGYFIKCAVLTDGDVGKKTENRAVNLKNDYEKNYSTIKVSVNKETFEKEIIDANKSGLGKEILLKALKKTRPNKGLEYEKECRNSKIETDTFFSMVEDYKSEFAFNLSEEINGTKKDVFQVPKYIKEAFDFLVVD
ncbi:Predicted ATP-dependent endonuclease of the OLD family, contains P-loop ATPase and TOPRIM domains [Salinibacillus kushneri]|uniref:Predicted ATP-dependent endonuclease of the OLD family, contains P-loop ATPase and TOPRIM domains n=1 Tax=Salinibacillus kushneri TaxID=237682 RepID=A0A1I0A6D8_9BACI|nr:AAA family ATPase [Salinibacillus kushneri]SES88772.1 Predicted ATP-dependent endonuclease of the OLD family, contains P-loop ATPase and TOPRIM domains [Salinibacillus kushneri]